MPNKPRMPIRKIGRTAATLATGVALATTLGLHGDVKSEHVRKRRLDKHELRLESQKPIKELLKDPKFRLEVAKENEKAKLLLKKLQLGQLTPEEVKQLQESIENDLKEIQINAPEIMQASIFDLKATINELKTLFDRLIELLVGAGKNFWSNKEGIILAELIALATYLHIAKNIRVRNHKLIEGFKVEEPFRLDNYRAVPGQAPVIAGLALLVANYSHLALPFIFMNPSVRYYLRSAIRRIKGKL